MPVMRRTAMAPWRRLVAPAALVVLCAVASVAADGTVGGTASLQEAEQAQREAVLIEARSALAAIDEMIAAGQADVAADRLLSIRARLLLMSGSDVEALALRIDAARQRCLAQSRTAGIAGQGGRRNEALQRVYDVRGDQMAMIRDIFAERVGRIRGMAEHGHAELALAMARRLVTDYPHEAEAESLFNEILAKAHDRRRLGLAERGKELRQELDERIERSLIPTCYDGMPLYPEDWIDRVQNRHNIQIQDVRIPEWEERIRARLAERISINYAQQLPNEVFQDLQRRTGLNLLIDPAVFAKDKPFSMRASNITVEAALAWACRASEVSWTVARGGVCIGGEVDPELVNSFYDLSEVMFAGTDFPGRLIGLAPAAGGANGTVGGVQVAAQAAAQPPPANITADAVMELIKKAISPATWSRPGCTMAMHGNSLMVIAPARVQQLIRQFIRSRSNLQTMMVNLEMRWVEISDGFLEEIGVDWRAGDPAKNPIHDATSPSYDGMRHAGGSHVNTGSLTNKMPASMASWTSPSSTVGTGLQLSGALLKTIQLNAIASAVERTDRASLLSSPSITTISGVRSSCFFGQQVAYIAGYEIRGGGGGGGNRGPQYDPRIGNLQIGAVLDVKPLVSADGKYVKLDIQPQLADYVMYHDGITTTQNMGGGGGYDYNTGYLDAGLIRTVVMPIELPMVRLRSGATTSMIPHGGTLLLGGFGRQFDQSASTKVPFLGHIPFLGRLFGMRGRYSDRRQLYLLITANIHNYQELEATK